MTTRNIFGIDKNSFGQIQYVKAFSNKEAADKWLHTEEYDFCDRELMSKTAAIKIAGKTAVEKAEQHINY
jgi:hypothetical protein